MATGDALGGQTYFTGGLELQFPLGLPEEMGFKGAIFTDVGTLYDTDETAAPGSAIQDSTAIRASAGVGLSWRSPLGPIRLDLAKPYIKQDFDDEELFRFSFGTRF
jgi:outer membrane protein insertion porin family